MMPRSVRIVVFALVINALLGIALLFDDDLPGTAIAGVVLGFVALDALALGSLAVLASRRKLPPWTVLGLTAWFVSLLAGIYNAAWIVQVVTGDEMPSWSPGTTWIYVETLGRMVGQLSIILAFAAMLKNRALWLGTAVWLTLSFVALYFEIELVSPGDLDGILLARYGREIAMSAALLLFAWIVVTGDRELRDRDLAPARVVR